MANSSNLLVRIQVDGFESYTKAMKRLELMLWDLMYAEDYNRATVRVVTAR